MLQLSVTSFAGRVADELASIYFGVLSLVAVDSVLHLVPESPDQSLHRPGSSISQSTNCVSFDLVRELLKHVDFSEVSIAVLDSLQQVYHPSCAFTTGSALATRLVLVELGESKDCIDRVSGAIHDYHCCSSQSRSPFL